MKESKFPITLEVLSQIFIIIMLVVGLDFLLLKWVPINILAPISAIILILAVAFLAWYNTRTRKS